MSIKSWLTEKALTGKFPLWIYRLAGKKIAKKIGLEDNMADETVVVAGDTKSKPWYVSKGKIAAIVTVLVGAVEPISTAFGHPIVFPKFIIEMLIGLGVYGIRDAIKS